MCNYYEEGASNYGEDMAQLSQTKSYLSKQKSKAMSKTFFTHTTKINIVKQGFVPAATIALRREGNFFYYGVAICSRYDNFSKKYGREQAEKRLNQGFGKIEIPSVLLGVDDKTACLAQLYNIASSVVVKNRKWKKKITKFNLAQDKTGKLVTMDTTKPVA